ncbi:MAG: VanW family protein [Candidatus Shapirobacteria bacterium]|nr:VanW family protein [Candidatus Shapirobacteria bacterium]
MNKKSIIYLILIVLFIFITLLFGPIIANYDKTGSNTYLLNKNYSYLSRNQILDQIDKDFIIPKEIILVLPNQEKIPFSLASISAQIDKNKTASTMLYRRLNQGITAYINYFFKPKNFNLDISFDVNKLNEQIDSIASQTEKPFIPTEINYKNNNIVVSLGSTGIKLNKDSLINQINTLLITGNFSQEINIETEKIGFIPTDDEINNAKLKAQKLIKKSLTLNENFNKIIIDNNTLISWIGFESNYQQIKIDNYIKSLNTSLARDPVDAVFNFENNKVTEFKPAQNGIKIKEAELSDLITKSLNKLINSEELSDNIVIPVVATEPKIKNEDANNLGIKDLLGRGTSSFRHSSNIRNMNVEKGASIINRILVAPDETFSFIKNLGEVSLDAGFKKAYVIRQGKTELDVGGGICQVSTTLFRAMLDAGLDITARQNHAYRVSYYEEDNKPGFDATVFIPSPDLKFINDTGHYLLIQSAYDGTKKSLTYEIYGTSDGRKVEISNYKQWGSQAPPPDIWIDDPTLPVGKTIQDEQRIPGLKTSFDWTVTKADGSILRQKTFQSSFVPWAAVFRRGTKTN